MKVIVTCGPSYEPVDQVRRLTNFSTGELGILLANRLARDGVEVLCLKGEAATTSLTLDTDRAIPFSTNAHLHELLTTIAQREQISAVFHAAALCDFKVRQVLDAKGEELNFAKISSRAGLLQLTLEPAPKLIGELRALFPKAFLIGWKYEVNGTREDALAKAREQIAENQTNTCVVNGAAYGKGFGFLNEEGQLRELPDKLALCEFLACQLPQR
jgi:phosphopantothenoylcysteine synthetase/decarboxylase